MYKIGHTRSVIGEEDVSCQRDGLGRVVGQGFNTQEGIGRKHERTSSNFMGLYW